jgi:cell division protein FtsZ
MREMGKAMMGTGEASGEKRALRSAEAAISNPLMDDVSLRGARGVLISITGGKDLTLYEVDEAATRIREEVDADANIIVGATFDESLEGIIRVSVVATGVDIDAAHNVRSEVSLHAPTPLAHQLKVDHMRIAELAEMPEARVLRSASIAAETKISIPPPTAQHATPAPRLSSIEDFPTPGRNEFRARRGELAQEDHPEKRPLSLLQRLGRVG